MGAAQTGGPFGQEGRGGEIHGPEKHSGCVKVDTPGGEDAADLGPVAGKVEARARDAAAEDKGAALRPSHVVEADAGVEVMATAGAPAHGGTLTAAAVGEDVATGANVQRLRTHRELRRVNRSG